ncbi:MAG: serine/threonine protein kinase [Candidatus Obscuribacterales bacterium]|nr:serine/threonine protein kinase [Candidatus Obscuribacterales bacterium]
MNQNADDHSSRDHSEAIISEEQPALRIHEADPLIGKLIDGRFLIESVLGIGGMATAYRAKQIDLERTVVIKVLRGETDEEGLLRFQREALVLSKLDAPGIVKIFTFGISEGLPYMAMDLVQGESLAQLIDRSGPLLHEQILNISIQLCEALERAHEAGILHRDIKPSNIMVQLIDLDEPKTYKAQLLDFGIAKVTSSKTATLTSEGDIFGSPPYMSPEQCFGKPVDARSDIYSLACTMFEMATARTPYDGSSPAEILLKHCNEKIPSFLERNAKIQSTVELEEIVQKCMSKAPEQRYSSMKELKEELISLSQNSATRSLSSLKGNGNTFQRHKILMILSAVCMLISLVAAIVFTANAEFWESVLIREEDAGQKSLLPATEMMAERAITSTDRSSEACITLMRRLERLKKKHGQIYRVALPQTLHFVAAHANQFNFSDLSNLSTEACLYCLDSTKLKQEFDLANVPNDLHLLSKKATGLNEQKTVSKAEEGVTFLWKPFYVYCQFKMKPTADQQFEELAIKQFDLILPQFRYLLQLVSKIDVPLAQSHIQYIFDHLFECQAIMGEAQARTFSQNIIKELPVSQIASYFQTNYSLVNGKAPLRLSADHCKAYLPIALYLYELSQKDEKLHSQVVTPPFFRHMVMGALEQKEKGTDLPNLKSKLLKDESDKWINAVHINLTDAEPHRYREFWSEQAQRLLHDPSLDLAPRQEALLNIGIALESIRHGDDDLAHKYYDQASTVIMNNPQVTQRKTRVVFRMLVLTAYFAYQDGDKETAASCIKKFIPDMPRQSEPYLLRSLQERLVEQLKSDGRRDLALRIERKLKRQSQYSEFADLHDIAEQLTDDDNY